MTLSDDERARLDGLLSRLALGEAGDDHDYTYAATRAYHLLNADWDDRVGKTIELRLRLALHLAPPSAIKYRASNPVSQHALVREHLIDAFGLPAETAAPLGRAVAQVLRDWSKQRAPVTTWRDALLAEQQHRCNHCHFRFDVPPSNAVLTDPYKPYGVDVDLYASPEVDHIEAVSALGSNSRRNLQVLCALCNRGKGQGLGVRLVDEYQDAARAIREIEVLRRARMLFYVVGRGNGRCATCNSTANELTMRLIHPNGAYVRTNLRAICRSCDSPT